MRHGFAVGDNLPAGAAVFGLREMLVTVGIGHVGGRRRSAAGKRPCRQAEAHGAPPSPIARIHVRFKARNAHHAYSGRAPAQGSTFKRRARHSNRIFPNHQARCALLIPLRFEFANEFRLPPAERGTSRRRATRAPIRWTAVPPSAAFRPRGVTPKRGNNVASPRGADNHPILRRTGRGESQRQPARISKTQVRIAAPPSADG